MLQIGLGALVASASGGDQLDAIMPVVAPDDPDTPAYGPVAADEFELVGHRMPLIQDDLHAGQRLVADDAVHGGRAVVELDPAAKQAPPAGIPTSFDHR